MAEDPSNNIINNYKGVMLCSRPNQKKAIVTQKPFCGRVVPGEQLGINPVKLDHYAQPEVQNKKPGVLSKHKQWLNAFKDNVQKTKQELEEKARKEQQKFKKIKQQAQADRERAKKMKEQYNQTATKVLNVLDQKSPSAPTGELTFDNLRRLDAANQPEKVKEKQNKKGDQFRKKTNDKPVWAMTKEVAEQTQEKQMDQLLDFFQQNDVNTYSQDAEIKTLLSNLKEKIEKMKSDDNWKQKEANRIQKIKQKKQQDDDDKYSQFSGGMSEGKSVASQKSQKKMEELRAKMKQQKQWDKHTTSEKNSFANLEDRIAKNLADQVLRNYPAMKGVHSNTSIRKLLEAEAAKVMNEPIIRPVITTVVRQKQGINANNLPYLHRNPAI